MAGKGKKKKAKKGASAPMEAAQVVKLPQLILLHPPTVRTQTLLDTVSSGDTVSLNRMIGSYGFQQNLKSVDANGSTAIHIAARKNDISMVRNLLTYPNLQINAVEDSKIGGYSALHIACSNGNVELAQLLIDNGANFNLKTTSSLGETPLHVCCKHGQSACAKLLLTVGAAADPRDSFGHNPSFWAYTKSFGGMIKECSLPPIHRATVQDHLSLLAARHPKAPGSDKPKKKKRGKSADGKKKKKK
jgi:hypothetical protein